MKKRSIYNSVFKRGIDLLLASVGLLVSAPVLLAASLYIRSDSPGGAIFSQERVGYQNKTFKIYKLRTMMQKSIDEHGCKIRDRHRVTKAGSIIRKLSIDELPQLYNIFKGDMSFVGPRPLLVRYLPYYTMEELRRHDVRPGITGLAQINGRGNLQWEERFCYDLQYVDNVSLILDLKIVLKTIKKVFMQEGTSTIRPAFLVDFDVHRGKKNIQ